MAVISLSLQAHHKGSQQYAALQGLFAALAASICVLLGCSDTAQAAGIENVSNLIAQAVPEAVSSAVSSTIAPVAEKTAAFIPGKLQVIA